MKEQTLEHLREVYPGVSRFAPDAIADLFVSAHLIEQIERRIRDLAGQSGIPPHHFFVLERLALHGGSAPLAELLKELGLPKQSATYILDRLEKNGMIERQKDTHDRRRLNMVLTEAGDSFVRKHFKPFYDAMLEAISGVPQKERKAMTNGLRTLLNGLQDSGEEETKGSTGK